MRNTQRLHWRQWCALGGLCLTHFLQKRDPPLRLSSTNAPFAKSDSGSGAYPAGTRPGSRYTQHRYMTIASVVVKLKTYSCKVRLQKDKRVVSRWMESAAAAHFRNTSIVAPNTNATTAMTEMTGSESFAKSALGTRLNLVPNAAFAAPSATANASSCRSFVVRSRLKDMTIDRERVYRFLIHVERCERGRSSAACSRTYTRRRTCTRRRNCSRTRGTCRARRQRLCCRSCCRNRRKGYRTSSSCACVAHGRASESE
mmetsp:Transcript_15427/g.65067  ORF Transcript_15427/g.65067 Transcript_15427/m.65067 type:complete len:257 (+) Transcript_15427:718-1488(+)